MQDSRHALPKQETTSSNCIRKLYKRAGLVADRNGVGFRSATEFLNDGLPLLT
jgi:hypothetical protein